ncbi:maleylpyruvate isomerase family mycothiol-dependent enzyme [Kribbia dieselivorans]|uniref:maleylpyruvate isomerase family mycothiol-dependent enzyme n=1 Tax=Kribbia dieselivorans TaxID=331526 RepID=UPI000838DFF8|nr:maleylpyruvate isomerase family mycothiol-dependent enzyme [Kribbia dieselivorans]
MALHPAAPDDVDGILAAWAHSVQAIIDLGGSCRTEEFALETACPGWSVKDQISHVTDIEDQLAGGAAPPPVAGADRAHVRSAMGERTEAGVELRRDRPGQAVVDELELVLAKRHAQLRDGLDSGSLTPETVVTMPIGPMPLVAGLRTRCFDVWTHEQDIRLALGQPGNLDSPAAAVTMAQFERSLPRVVAKSAAIEPGHAVIIDLTGPLVGRMGVRVVETEDGKRRGEPLFTGEKHEGEDDQRTVISLSTAGLGRLIAGRAEPAQVNITVSGDESVARRVIEHLNIAP